MTQDLLEMVNTNRSNASHKISLALNAIENAINDIENTSAAIEYYIKISSKKDIDLFKSVTSGKKGVTRSDVTKAISIFRIDIENEYYPLSRDVDLFIEFIVGKSFIDAKLLKKLRNARKGLLHLTSLARYYEHQLNSLL
jgi:hypothetical protein